MKKTIYLALLPGILVCFNACTKNVKVDCTTDYKLITTGVVDAMGKPVLDAFTYTIRQSNGDTVRRGSIQPQSNSYIVLTDDEKEKVSNQGENFKFLVRKDNKFVSGIYKVRTDYCHIIYISGPTKLTLK